MRLIAVAVTGVLATFGGCGTIFSRADDHVIGGYPLAGVGLDLWCIGHLFGPHVDVFDVPVPGPMVCVVGLFSLPVDLVVDVVLLPLDTVGWCAGIMKRRSRYVAIPLPR